MACIILAACGGFKLRGSLDIPNYLRTIYITPDAPYEPFQRELRARLKANDIKVIKEPSENITTLALSSATSNEQSLAVGSSGEVQRYRLSITVSYTLTVKSQNNLRIQQTITRTRDLNRSNNMLLSNESESQSVKNELLSETVSELLRQITVQPQHKESIQQNSPNTSNSPC